MEISYPRSFQQKVIIICPYVCDNSIETSKEAEKGTISWMKDIEKERANTLLRTKTSHVETSKEDTETFVYQYNVNTHVMQSFDLSGQRTKLRKDLKKEVFDKKTVLAMGGNKLNFLTTSSKKEYMEELSIVHINDYMEPSVIVPAFKTKEMNVESLKGPGGQQIDLFSFLLMLKSNYGCVFEYQLNDEKLDVLILCKSKRDGNILAAIVLYDSNDKTSMCKACNKDKSDAQK